MTCKACGHVLFKGREEMSGLCRSCLRDQVNKWSYIWWGSWPWAIPYEVIKALG